jgi:butyrate kinase
MNSIKMKKILILVLLLGSSLFLNACLATKVVDIKSPCVSDEDGPCGPRKSINDWWLKSKIKS